MELELKKETCDTYEPGGEWTLSQEETAETIVPDYCPNAARIIDTTGAVYVHSREIRDGKAFLSGSVRVTVLYTPEGESGVHTLEFSMPFTMEGDGRWAQECTVLADDTAAEYLESRLLNPRKVFTRCKITSRLTPYRRTVLSYATDAEAAEGLCLEKRREAAPAALLTQIVEREFTFTDELELPSSQPGAAELLSARVFPSVTETKILGNKLVVKGNFTVSLLYVTEEGDCGSAAGELPFSQILDLEETAEGAWAEVRLQLSGMDIQIAAGDPEGRVMEVTLYVHALGKVYQERELALLRDLYSTACDVRCETETLTLSTQVQRQTRRQAVRELMEIGVKAEELLSLTAVCGPVTVTRDGNTAALRTTAAVRALYLDEGGVPLVAERRMEAGCQADVPEGAEVSVWAECPEEVRGTLEERGIEVRFPVDFQIASSVPVRQLCVASAELDRETVPETGSLPSLVLRRVGRDETAWDLAKAYRTTIRDIYAVNQLPPESDLPREELLLIPRRRAQAG